MTQRQWGGAPYGQQQTPYGSQPPAGWGGRGFGQAAYGQPYRAQPAPGTGPRGNPPGGFGGPQPGVPHYGPPVRAPRRRSPLMSLLLGLVGLSLLAIVGLVLVSALGSESTTAYQNENYQVPPPDSSPPAIPLPTTYTEAEDWLVNSRLYGQTAPIPVRCDNPPINVANASDADLETHFNGQVECLMRVWDPPVAAARFLLPRPSVTIYGEGITTKCGESGVNAFYCSADQQIYFSNLLPQAVPIVRTNRWSADVVMAHEFGHAIQGRTGLLISAHALAQDAGSEPESNRLIRRLETQADCFAGVYLRSVSRSLGVQQSDLRGIQDTFVAVGDDTVTGEPDAEGNHGLARTREYWGTVGLGTGDLGQCNTFTAPARLVR